MDYHHHIFTPFDFNIIEPLCQEKIYLKFPRPDLSGLQCTHDSNLGSAISSVIASINMD